MNLFSRPELVSKTIFTLSQIRALCKNGFFEDMQIINKKYYFSKTDLDKLMRIDNFCRNSFSTEQVQNKLSGVLRKSSNGIIKKYNLVEGKDYILFLNTYYFNPSSIELLEKQQFINPEVYISISEAIKTFHRKSLLRDRIRKGYIESFKFPGVYDHYIKICDLEAIHGELKLLEDYYSTTDIATLIDVEFKELSAHKLSSLNPISISGKLYFSKNKILSLLNNLHTIPEIQSTFCITNKRSPSKYISTASTIPDNYLTIAQKTFNLRYLIKQVLTYRSLMSNH